MDILQIIDKHEDKEYVIVFNGKRYNMGICGDDTIRVVAQKAMHHLNITTPYLWVHRKITMTNLLVYNFTDHLFGQRKFISVHEACRAILNYFDKPCSIMHDIVSREICIASIKALDIRHILEPLMFKFKNMSDNYVYFPIRPSIEIDDYDLENCQLDDLRNMLVYNFEDVSDGEIHVHDFGATDSRYVPLVTEQFTNTELDNMTITQGIRDRVAIKKDYTTVRDTWASYLKFIVSNGFDDRKRIALDKLFLNMHASLQIPFFKYISQGKTLYKLFKPAIVGDRFVKELEKLKEAKLPYIDGEAPKNVLILFVESSKSDNRQRLAKIYIYESLVFEVKLNISRNEANSVKESLLCVNQALNYISDFLPSTSQPIFGRVMISDMISVRLGGTMSCATKHITITSLTAAISKYNTYFHTISRNKSELKLYYKRSSNFASDKNIKMFLRKLTDNSDTVKKQKLKLMFVLKHEQVEEYFQLYQDELAKIKDSQFLPPSHGFVDCIKVSLKVSNDEISFGLENITCASDYFHVIPIIMLLAYDSCITHVVEKKEVDEDANYFLEDSSDIDDDTMDDRIDSVSRSTTTPCPTFPSKLPYPPVDTIYGQKSRYFMNELKESDKQLFDKPLYSRNCPANANRQPNVIGREELEYNDRCFPNAYPNYLTNLGKNKENVYVCPAVWCPTSRIGMSYEQYTDVGFVCPSVHERAIVLNQHEYFSNKSRHIKISDLDGLPCCTKKLDKKDEQEGAQKYIKDEKANLLPERYGLLPRKLASLFQNVHCGKSKTMNGDMSMKTSCFLRYGVKISIQPFMSCMVDVLDNQALTSPSDISKTIYNNLTMDLFITLNDGNICRSFMGDIASLPSKFQDFKKWFTHKQQNSYVVLYQLEKIRDAVGNMNLYDPNTFVAEALECQFILYTAFHAYREYVADDFIVKRHDLLNDIMSRNLSWLNMNGYNIVVFSNEQDETFTTNSVSINKQSQTVFILNTGQLYEPIHHVRLSSGKKIVSTRIHSNTDDIVQPIVSYLNSQGSNTLRDVAKQVMIAIKALGDRVTKQVINRDLQLVGFFTSAKHYVPFENPTSILRARRHPNGIRVNFIDDFLTQQVEFASDMMEWLQRLNTIMHLTHVHVSLYQAIQGNHGMLYKNTYIPLHAVAVSVNNHKLIRDIYNDRSLFSGNMVPDDRSKAMKTLTHMSKWYTTFKNEVFAFIDMDHVDFIRNQSNPMPMSHKREYIREKLNDVNKFNIKRLFTFMDGTSHHELQNLTCKSVNRTIRDVDFFGESLETIQVGQCVYNTKTKLTTFLISQDTYDTMFERMLDDLLNPLIVVEHVNVVDAYEINANGTIVFTEDDVADSFLTMLLENILSKNIFGVVSTSKLLELPKIGNAQYVASSTFVDVMDALKPSMPEFEINEFQYYDKDTIYHFFAHVYGTINADQMNVEALKSYVAAKRDDINDDLPDRKDIDAIAHVLNITIVILKRKENNSNLSVFGTLYTGSPIVILSASRKTKKHYDVVYRKRNQYILKVRHIPTDLLNLIHDYVNRLMQ